MDLLMRLPGRPNDNVHRIAMNVILLALSIVMPTNVMAQEVEKPQKPAVASLVAGPAVCVRQEEEELCSMEAALIWEVPHNGNHCIWDSDASEPIRCWQQAWSGTVQLRFVSEKSRTYLLTQGSSEKVVAETTIKVMGALEQRLRARRRNGFWRMF